MEYRIRKATKNDVEELSRLKQIMWMQTYRGIYSDDVIDNFDYEKDRENIKNNYTDRVKLQDALLVLQLMEAPMDLVFLVKQRLKKLGKKDYFN